MCACALACMLLAMSPRAASAAPQLLVRANLDQFGSVSVSASDVDANHMYDIVESGNALLPSSWACNVSPMASFDYVTWTYVAGCYIDSTCRATPCPKSAEATSFVLLDTTLGVEVARVDVPSLVVRADRDTDIVSGRSTPNTDYDISIVPPQYHGSDYPEQATEFSSTTDATGLIAASFSGADHHYDFHAWDTVRVTVHTNESGRYDYRVSQTRMRVKLINSVQYGPRVAVMLDNPPPGTSTVTLTDAGGTPRAPAQPITSHADTVIELQAHLGDRVVVEDNGGVRIASMSLPQAHIDSFDVLTDVVHGSMTAPSDSTPAAYRLVGLYDDYDLTDIWPRSFATVPIDSSGSFSGTVSDSAFEYGSTSNAGFVSGSHTALFLIGPTDDVLDLTYAQPGFLVDLDTGILNVGTHYALADNPTCPIVHVDDGRADLPSHVYVTRMNEKVCIAQLAPVPTKGRTISLRDAVGTTIASDLVPAISFAYSAASKRVTSSYSTNGHYSESNLDDPVVAAVWNADPNVLVDYTPNAISNSPYDAATFDPPASCGGVGHSCGTLRTTISTYQTLRFSIEQHGRPHARYIRSAAGAPSSMHVRYNAVDGQIYLEEAAVGLWTVNVVGTDGSLKHTRAIRVFSANMGEDVLVGSDGRPVATYGDHFELISPTGGHITKPIEMPRVGYDQTAWTRSAGLPLGTTTASGSLKPGANAESGRDEPTDSNGLATLPPLAADACVSEVWLTWKNTDNDVFTNGAGAWCWKYDDATRELTVHGGQFDARAVEVRRGGVRIGGASLTTGPSTTFPATDAGDGLLPGDTIVISGTGGRSVVRTVPRVASTLDVGSDRLVTAADIGVSVAALLPTLQDDDAVLALDTQHHAIHQFGLHAPVPIDFDGISDDVHVEVRSRGGAWRTTPTVPDLSVTRDADGAGTIDLGSVADGIYDLASICGTNVERHVTSVAHGDASVDLAQFTRVPLGAACALVLRDAAGYELVTTEVPQLQLEQSADGSELVISGEPSAHVVVTWPDGDAENVTTDASGAATLTINDRYGDAYVSLRDRARVVWRRVLAVTAPVVPDPTVPDPPAPDPTTTTTTTPPPVTHGADHVVHLLANGAHVADPSGASVTIPAGAYTGSFATVGVIPHPSDQGAVSSAASRGFAAGSSFVDVSIFDAGDLATERDVHDLPVPIRVVVPIAATNTLPDGALAPAWFSDGRWKLSPHITAGVLPRELSDGWWLEHQPDGSRLVVFLTRHLTQFGVLHDVRKPRWVRSRHPMVVSRLTGDRRSLTWAMAVDSGSGLAGFRFSSDGGTAIRLGPSTYRYGFRVRGPRQKVHRVCIAAVDRAGNANQQCLKFR